MKYINRMILVISSLLLLYELVLIIFFGNPSFAIVIAVVALLGVGYGFLQYKSDDKLLDSLPRYIRYLIYGVSIIAFSLFIIVETIIVKNAIEKTDIEVDKVIVLGAGLKGDKLTKPLQYRLDATITYYQQYPDVSIIVSGGQGVGESTSEAFAMKKYLVANGIPESKIITEDKSATTDQNFEFSAKYLNENDKVLIVTNGFHMARAKMIATKYNIDGYGYSARSYLPTALNYYIREFFGYVKEYTGI